MGGEGYVVRTRKPRTRSARRAPRPSSTRELRPAGRGGAKKTARRGGAGRGGGGGRDPLALNGRQIQAEPSSVDGHKHLSSWAARVVAGLRFYEGVDRAFPRARCWWSSRTRPYWRVVLKGRAPRPSTIHRDRHCGLGAAHFAEAAAHSALDREIKKRPPGPADPCARLAGRRRSPSFEIVLGFRPPRETRRGGPCRGFITCIGFVGAGVNNGKQRVAKRRVEGLTTAASIWTAAGGAQEWRCGAGSFRTCRRRASQAGCVFVPVVGGWVGGVEWSAAGSGKPRESKG
jgi:hypothetical protein